ncbi:MAG TPA: hypothetical protein PK781_03430 [Terrimesophilobacter sp.]|nr:hypothetical protein [Terrimesophilobacter sp.]
MDEERNSQVHGVNYFVQYLAEIPPEQWERVRMLLGHPASEEFLATIR